MSRHFKYYDDWRSAVLECPNCGWKGNFEEGAGDYYDELMDCVCPRCPVGQRQVLAIVSYPTVNEMLASGNAQDVAQAKRIIASSKNDATAPEEDR